MRSTQRPGVTHKVQIGGVKGFITITENEHGPVDIFIHGFGKLGSAMQGWADAFAIMLSKYTQQGGSLSDLAEKFRAKRFEPFGPTDNPNIPYCDSLPDYILRYIAQTTHNEHLAAVLRAVYEKEA